MKQNFDCIIIGAGIGGVSAAVYLKRSGKKVLIIEKGPIGGNLVNTSVVENYPGFESITGFEFSLNLEKQIKYNDIDFISDEVIELNDLNETKEIKTKNDVFYSKYVIIATGRVPRKLGIENEDKLVGKGISYCAICDGFFYKDKEVVVVGGGNSSFEGILYLSNFCKKVYVINRHDNLRADDTLIKEVNDKGNIEIVNNSKVTKLLEEDNRLVGVELNNSNIISTNGLSIYIGLVPSLNFGESITKENGYIIVNKKMQTSMNNVYAIGDIIKKDYYQLIQNPVPNLS